MSNFKNGYSKTAMEKLTKELYSKRKDKVADFLSQVTDGFLFTEAFVDVDKLPNKIKTDKYIYEISYNQCGNEKEITVETYRNNYGRHNDFLCSETWRTIEIVYTPMKSSTKMKFMIVNPTGRPKTHKYGLMTQIDKKHFASVQGYYTNVTINEEFIAMFAVVTKAYFNRFKSTPVQNIKSEKFSFAGYSHRDGKYEIRRYPYAGYVDEIPSYNY